MCDQLSEMSRIKMISSFVRVKIVLEGFVVFFVQITIWSIIPLQKARGCRH